jgi:hypothetical protein
MPTAQSTAALATYVHGSLALTPQSMLAVVRVAQNANGRPQSNPTESIIALRDNTVIAIDEGVAPKAILIPMD